MKRLAERLPSIGVLLALSGLLAFAPLAFVGRTEWRLAADQVDAAEEVAELSRELDAVVRLSASLTTEKTTSVWTEAIDGPDTDAATGATSPNRRQARAAVDRVLGDLGDPEVTASVLDLRTKIDRGFLDPPLIDTRYRRIGTALAERRSVLFDSLNDATARAGNGGVKRRARVTEAAADVAEISGNLGGAWLQLALSPAVEPTPTEVSHLAELLGRYQDRATNFRLTLIDDSETARRWKDIQGSPELRDLLITFETSVEDWIRTGIDGSGLALDEPAAQDGGGDGDGGQPIQERLSEVGPQLLVAESFHLDMVDLVELSLSEVEQAGVDVVAGAKADRNRTLFSLAGAGLMILAATGGVVLLVTRPVQRLALTAQGLSLGNLNRNLAEQGPKEIRVAAAALNDARRSMQLAEAQADALADARLDDPILSQTAPGALGASLQAAVSRLASSLAEEEDFRHRLAHAAVHDNLTKLANRNAVFLHLEAALARARRSSTALALLQIDIDDFKSINDLHGHEAGDLVLRTLSQRLTGAIRAGDQAGRLGSDQFVVVAEPVEYATDAVRLAERIVDHLTAPIALGSTSIRIRVSVGVGVSSSGLTADELVRDTDLALFKAKSDGKSRIEVCDEELRAKLRHLSGMEQGIRQALERDEFCLHYQAAVSSKDHRVVSLEALIRWERPRGGPVSPGEFIPVAERSELIVELDRWVIERAIRQLADWSDHPVLGRAPVSVNISSRHLGSGTVFHDVAQALEQHGVDPSRLIIEVTETAVLDDLGRAAAELARLRELGVLIALDDFGTGYMSLSHLRRLPVDVLKIDRSFVWSLEEGDPDDAEHSLVRLMVQTGHLLGMKVTAEGVETTTQAERLAELGTDTLQGFLFSRPLDRVATAERLTTDPLAATTPT